jgi:hypothetical protein
MKSDPVATAATRTRSRTARSVKVASRGQARVARAISRRGGAFNALHPRAASGKFRKK